MKKILLSLSVFGAAVYLLAGCGSNTTCPAGQTNVAASGQAAQCVVTSGAGVYGVNGYTGYGSSVCTPPLVSTQYGCLAQGSCAIGSAQYNNSCVPATAGYGGAGYGYTGYTGGYGSGYGGYGGYGYGSGYSGCPAGYYNYMGYCYHY